MLRVSSIILNKRIKPLGLILKDEFLPWCCLWHFQYSLGFQGMEKLLIIFKDALCLRMEWTNSLTAYRLWRWWLLVPCLLDSDACIKETDRLSLDILDLGNRIAAAPLEWSWLRKISSSTSIMSWPYDILLNPAVSLWSFNEQICILWIDTLQHQLFLKRMALQFYYVRSPPYAYLLGMQGHFFKYIRIGCPNFSFWQFTHLQMWISVLSLKTVLQNFNPSKDNMPEPSAVV